MLNWPDSIILPLKQMHFDQKKNYCVLMTGQCTDCNLPPKIGVRFIISHNLTEHFVLINVNSLFVLGVFCWDILNHHIYMQIAAAVEKWKRKKQKRDLNVMHFSFHFCGFNWFFSPSSVDSDLVIYIRYCYPQQNHRHYWIWLIKSDKSDTESSTEFHQMFMDKNCHGFRA